MKEDLISTSFSTINSEYKNADLDEPALSKVLGEAEITNAGLIHQSSR
jgi:hypothetical protein